MESTNHHVDVERESMPIQSYEAKVPIYSDDLLLDLQRTLAVLADIETKYEIERDFLESWSGPREVKDHLLATLEQCHRANCGQVAVHLERLRQGRGLELASPRRTDH
jgi:hypothetical protein